VIDPAAGSYYIENLTDSIAAHAWELFKNTEKEGGILKAISSDTLATELKESRLKREKEISSRKAILLGTNQYPNNQETMLDKIELPIEEITENTNSRDAVAFEQVRLATEKFTKLHHSPSIFLLKVGNLAFRQARGGFTTNFFGCAGFDIIDNSGFATVEEGVGAAIESNADIVVMCSSDEEYTSLGVAAAQLLKSKKPNLLFVIAGNPVDAVDALKTAGVDDFIHVRTNILESLRNFQQKLNIEQI
jgi:methylmalonyl-CoA mutase